MTPKLPKGFLDRHFAHRGLHDAVRPENSAAAIEAAIDVGYGIEMDIQMSADGQAMVFHDAILDRVTDKSGPVHNFTAEELSQTRILGTSETIPTFARVLGLVAGRVPLLVELKDQDGTLGPDVGPLETAIARDLKGYDGPVAVMAFNPHSVVALRELAPDTPRGLTTEDFPSADWPDASMTRLEELTSIPDFDRAGAVFISHDVRDLHSAPVARFKAQGVPVLCWTVRSPEAGQEALKIADAVTFEGYRPAVPGA